MSRGLTADVLRQLRSGALVVSGPASVVHLRGPDARRFANGMFTNNVRDLGVGGANRHAIVDDRGRVGGFLDLLCLADDHFLAILDGLDAAAFCTRFEPYVVFDDVELEDAGAWQRVSVLGPDAVEAASAAGLPVPEVAGHAPAEAGFGFVGWGWPGRGLHWAVPRSETVVNALFEQATTADAGLLDAVRVLAGVPRYPDDTGDKGLPHELGLREGLLSFDKGCYLGQESINRIDVMGKVRKALRAVRVVAGAAVVHGDDVHRGDVRVGRLTSPIGLPDGTTVGLAVLKEPAHAVGGTVQVGDGRHEGAVLALPVAAELIAATP